MDSIVAADRGVLRDVPADTPRAGRLSSPSGRRGRRESGIVLAYPSAGKDHTKAMAGNPRL